MFVKNEVVHYALTPEHTQVEVEITHVLIKPNTTDQVQLYWVWKIGGHVPFIAKPNQLTQLPNADIKVSWASMGHIWVPGTVQRSKENDSDNSGVFY